MDNNFEYDDGDFNEDADAEVDIDNDEEEGEECEECEEEYDDVSEIYQPKVEKKDPIAKLNSKARNVIIVPPNERITDNRLHRNEASFIISTRAKQISKDGIHFLPNCTYNNAMSIAYHELYNHRCPLKLRRQVGISGKGDPIVEEWDVKTMVLPSIPPL